MEQGKRRSIVTTDLAVFASSSASSARLRDEHLWPVVFDANAMIRDVLHNTVPGLKPSALIDAVTVGTARLYGKPNLLEEVAQYLPVVAARKSHDLARAHAVLAFYVSRMRLVDPSGIAIPDTEDRLAEVFADDPDDEPTARLAWLLDPAILLTVDPDLLDHGFGVWYEPGERLATWTAAAFTLNDRSFGSQMDAGGKALGMAIAAPVLAGVGLGQAARAHPRAALTAGALALALGIATRRSPRWLVAREALADGFARTMAEVANRIPADAGERGAAARQAIGQLEAYRAEHASPGSSVAVIARTLAIAPVAGLTVKEIYDSTGHAFAVGPVLEQHPGLFSQDTGGRWLLGVPA